MKVENTTKAIQPDKARETGNAFKKELQVLGKIITALETLNDAEKVRLMRYLTSRYAFSDGEGGEK